MEEMEGNINLGYRSCYEEKDSTKRKVDKKTRVKMFKTIIRPRITYTYAYAGEKMTLNQN